MQQLTEHFADTELGVAGCWPQIVENAKQLCTVLLEPIRAVFGPVVISDGYRDPSHNARVGGVSHSQHEYDGQNSAADIVKCGGSTLQAAFDWIRLNSHLNFDQLILERAPGTNDPRCIHISYNGALAVQRREALTGETNGAGAYTKVEVGP
jgi:hypothetical protein